MSYTTVEVYCDEPSHAGRPWVIERFARLADEWLPLPGLLDGDTPLRRDADLHSRVDADTGAYLNGDITGPATVRDTYRLRCYRCGREARVRGDSLGPVFDRIADAGVLRISLRSLGAIVTG